MLINNWESHGNIVNWLNEKYPITIQARAVLNNLEAVRNIIGIKITSFQVGLFAINIIDDLFFHSSIKSC